MTPERRNEMSERICTCGEETSPAGCEIHTPKREVPIRGSVRVLAEIRNSLDTFGAEPFSADRSMLEHWASLIEAELSDEIRARMPEIEAKVNAYNNRRLDEKRDVLDLRMTV
jgi:hypothetical protein